MAKGTWRQAKHKTVKTRETWTLCASSGAADSAQILADLKARLESIALTEESARTASSRWTWQILLPERRS